MSDTSYRMQYPQGLRTNWAAIWAGLFTFGAIWITFEMLGVAIFHGTGGVWGMGTWTIILSIIAMYIAGLETGRLSGAASRHEGLIHALVMFGLSMVGLILMVAITDAATGAAIAASNGAAPVATTGFFRLLAPGAEWAEWLALFLSFCAAMAGGSTGVARYTAPARQPVEPPISMRPAA